MTSDLLTTVAVGANLAIAFAYLAIGVYITPKFSMAAPSSGSRLAKLCGLAFFVTCGVTHLELASHAMGAADAASADERWLVSWHGLAIHTVQAAAGLGFLALATRYLQVRIYNKQYYEHVLDERIKEIEDRLERT